MNKTTHPIRLGVIGLRNIDRNHLRAALRHSELVTVATGETVRLMDIR